MAAIYSHFHKMDAYYYEDICYYTYKHFMYKTEQNNVLVLQVDDIESYISPPPASTVVTFFSSVPFLSVRKLG